MNKQYGSYVISGLFAASMVLTSTSSLVLAQNFDLAADSKAYIQESDERQEGKITFNGEEIAPSEGIYTFDQTGTYELTGNVNGSIKVTDSANAVLKLSSYKITNKEDQHTITVDKSASLTIEGPGTVDNITHGCGAVLNNGTMTIKGGRFERSQEQPNNSWYTISNHGEMTIYDADVRQGSNEQGQPIYSGNSSLIQNGYYNYNNDYKENENSSFPTMTIYGGTFNSGRAAVKVDDGGTLNVYGGTFKGTYNAIANHNKAYIHGGSFTQAKEKEKEAYVAVILDYMYRNQKTNKGLLVLDGSPVITPLTDENMCFDVGGQDEDLLEKNPVTVGPYVVLNGKITKDEQANFVIVKEKPVKVTPVDMYRLYNPNSGEHFYTSDEKERNTLVSLGWRNEGKGWTAPSYSQQPVYRLYNQNAGDHHYTTEINEKDELVKKGWQYEGIGWYSDAQKRTPLYRAYNPNAQAGAHHYTTNAEEFRYLVSIGWRQEGIGWYGM